MDVLLLWDAIFAVGPTLELVDHIVLAMLLFIRDPCKSMQQCLALAAVPECQYMRSTPGRQRMCCRRAARLDFLDFFKNMPGRNFEDKSR